eukprot:m.390111 g.390111  ORF g.390111 m.390111 type:complete len:136 (+) comp20074_c6_seq3:4277-4684(+)
MAEARASDGGDSSSDEEMADVEMMVTSRPKRSTAGNRLAALLASQDRDDTEDGFYKSKFGDDVFVEDTDSEYTSASDGNPFPRLQCAMNLDPLPHHGVVCARLCWCPAAPDPAVAACRHPLGGLKSGLVNVFYKK